MRVGRPRVELVAGLALLLMACGKEGSKSEKKDEPTPQGGTAGTEGGGTEAKGGTEQGGAAGGEVIIWADDKRAAVLSEFATKFASTGGFALKVQAVSKDLQTNFVTASQAGKGPDIVVGAHDWIGNLVQNGAIEPIQLTDEQKGAFNPLAIKGVTFNGQVYAVPYAVENLALIRNTELAAEAPATMEDAGRGRQEAQVGEEGGRDPRACRSATTATPTTSIRSTRRAAATCSASAPTATTTPRTSAWPSRRRSRRSPRSASWARRGQARSSARSARRTRSACSPARRARSWSPGRGPSPTSRRPASSTTSRPIPGFEGGKPAKPFVGVQAFYVAAKGKNKALAQEFVSNYLTQPDLAVALYKAEPRPPALTAALEQVKAEDPDLEKFLEAGESGDILPAIPAMAAVWDPFGKAAAAVVGGANPKTTVAAAAKAIADQIK